jgi:hypothetical protein
LAKKQQAVFGFLIIQPGEIGFVFPGYVKTGRIGNRIKIIQSALLDDAIDGMAAVAAKGFVVINNGVCKAGFTAMVQGRSVRSPNVSILLMCYRAFRKPRAGALGSLTECPAFC